MLQKIVKIDQQLRSLIPLKYRLKVVSFIFVLLGTALDNYNVAGAITTAFSVSNHFGASTTTTSWVLSGYALTLGAFILLTGKMTDILGPENLFLIGLSMFSILSLLCAAIDNVIALIVLRAIKGIFGACLIPACFGITAHYFQGPLMKHAINGIMITLTSVLGVGYVVGGAFSLTSLGYKGFYYFNSGFGFLVVIVLYFYMVPIEKNEASKKMRMRDLDYIGSMTLVVGCLLIILGLTEGGEKWKQPAAYVPLVVGVLVVAVGVVFELVYIQGFKDKVDEEIQTNGISKASNDWRYKLQMVIPATAFKVPNFVQFLTATCLLYIYFIGINVVMMDYYLYVERNSIMVACLKMLPISVGMSFGVVVNKEDLIYKAGMKLVVVGSQVSCLMMIVWVSRHNYNVRLSYWKYEFVPLFLYGWGLNTYFGIYLNAIMRRTPIHLQGVVSGLLQTIAQIGLCLGNSISSSIIGELYFKDGLKYRRHVNDKLKTCMYFVIAVSALTVFVLLFVQDQKSVTEHSGVQDEKELEDISANATISEVPKREADKVA